MARIVERPDNSIAVADKKLKKAGVEKGDDRAGPSWQELGQMVVLLPLLFGSRQAEAKTIDKALEKERQRTGEIGGGAVWQQAPPARENGWSSRERLMRVETGVFDGVSGVPTATLESPAVCAVDPVEYFSGKAPQESEIADPLVNFDPVFSYLGRNQPLLNELILAANNLALALEAGGYDKVILPAFADEGSGYTNPNFVPQEGEFAIEVFGFEASAGGGYAFTVRDHNGVIYLPTPLGKSGVADWTIYPEMAVELHSLSGRGYFGEQLELVKTGGCAPVFVQLKEGVAAAILNPTGDLGDSSSLWKKMGADGLPVEAGFALEQLADMSDEQKLAAAPEWQSAAGENQLVLAKTDVYEGRYVRYFDSKDRPLKTYDLHEGEWHDGVSVYRYVDSETNQEASLTVFLTNDPSLSEINAKPYYVIPGKEKNLAEGILGYMALNWEIEKEGGENKIKSIIAGSRGGYQESARLDTLDKRLAWYNEFFAEFMSKLANGTAAEEVIRGNIALKNTQVDLSSPALTVNLVMGYDRRSTDNATSSGMPWITTKTDEQGQLVIKIFAKDHGSWWTNSAGLSVIGPGYGIYGGILGHSLRSLTTGEFGRMFGYDLGGLPLVRMCDAPTNFELWKITDYPQTWSELNKSEGKKIVPFFGKGLPEEWSVCGVSNK